MKITQTIAN